MLYMLLSAALVKAQRPSGGVTQVGKKLEVVLNMTVSS